MSDCTDLLERARRSAPTSIFTIEDVRTRVERVQRRRRVQAIAIGLIVAIIGSWTAVVALREQRSIRAGGDDGTPSAIEVLPAAPRSPLVAGPGQYYYTRVHHLAACESGECMESGVDYNELRAEFWWAGDDSGRIEVRTAHMYGIERGRFGPGEFPNSNGVDVSDFPTDPDVLTEFLLRRSAPDGSSPVPMVTPPPEGGARDGQLWRAITDLLQNPQVTPTVRAALLDVAAHLSGSHVLLDATDPVGRDAYEITFANWGGDQPEALFVDPATHELLAWSLDSSPNAPSAYSSYWVVEATGVSDSTETPTDSVIPKPTRSLPNENATG